MDQPSPAEIAVDSFLDRLLRGEAADVEAFLAEHPELGPDEVARVRKFARVLGRGGRKPAGASLPFEHLGAYRLLERLGAGGMGLVFLAEDERLGRRVALKLVRPELAGSDETAARFEREARAVARLQHEHIVTVFEAGRVGEVSFLAMEFVPGRSLDELYAEARLAQRLVPPEKLLRWARDVARALAAAHAQGVVHRDVKPSNVRVTPEGKALLLDFGLALAPDSASISRSGQVQGTLYYVSPEQLEGSLPADARTDVWSLGVTLYEGLTGHRPFEGQQSEEVLYQILSREPVAPRVLVPALARDVETVVLKALEKDRARRYASAGELADELDALLEGRPVRARPTGALTRAWKWSRRKPAHALSLALGALVLVGGPLVLALVQARHARALKVERDLAEEQRRLAEAQRKVADEQRQLAETRAGDLEELAMFQGESIGAIQPPAMAEHLVASLRDELRAARSSAGRTSAQVDDELAALDELLAGVNATNVAVASLRRELLEPAIAAARARFAERPKVQGMLLHTIAGTCWSLGLTELALDTQQASHDVLAAHVPPDDRDRLVSAANLGYYLLNAGRTAEAEPLLRSAADGLARLHGEDDARTLSARQNLALLLRTLGKLGEGEVILQHVLDTRRRTLGDDDPETLSTLSSLGGMLFLQERLVEAEPLLQEAYERRRETLGPGDQATLVSANNLAVLYRPLGRNADAERVLREALAGARTTLGDRHPTTNHMRLSLAELVSAAGRPEEAAALLRESVAACRESAGPAHADTLLAVAQLGEVLEALGEREEAEGVLGEAYEQASAALGPAAKSLRPVARKLAALLLARGAGEESLELTHAVGSAVRAESGNDDASAQDWLALELRALTAAKRFAEAAATLDAARPARATPPLQAAVDALFAAWPEGEPARAEALAR